MTKRDSNNGDGFGMRPVPHDEDFARQNKNAKDAEKIIAAHALSKWLEVNGAALHRAERAAENLRAEADALRTQLHKARIRRDGFNERVNAARLRDGDEDAPDGKDTPFKGWNPYDKAIVISALCAMAFLLVLGAANVAVTVQATGIPVFLEHPYFAWMLGGLVPASAMAVKSGYHLFSLDSSRRIYAFTIYGLAGALMIAWIILFIQTFEGVTGDIDWSAFTDDGPLGSGHDPKGQLRNMVQIMGEIVIGASLFLVIDRIQATYSASYTVANPNWIHADKRVNDVAPNSQKTEQAACEAEARVVQMHAARDVYIGEALAILREMKNAQRPR